MELEKFQNKIMRYALNAHAATSIHVMRSELGWWSMKGRIFLRKLNFYGTLVNLPYTRWARAALEECMWLGGSWFQEVLEICNELNLEFSPWCMTLKEWKRYVRKRLNQWEYENNMREIGVRSSLACYPGNEQRSKGKGYLLERGATDVCKFRTNQILYEAKAAGEKKCILCGSNAYDAQHYLLDCEIVIKLNLKKIIKLREEGKAIKGLEGADLVKYML